MRLSGKMRCFGFHGTPCPRSGSSCGTEGATLLVSLDPWFRANVAHNITWTPRDFYIGQENSRPRFGITMMHLCRSYVVKSDFCCLLSCCCLSILGTINVLSALHTGLGPGLLMSSSALISPSGAYLNGAFLPAMDLLLSVPSPCIVRLLTRLGTYLAVCRSTCSGGTGAAVFMRMEFGRFSKVFQCLGYSSGTWSASGHRTQGVPDPDCHCCDTFFSTSIPGLPSHPSLGTIDNLPDPVSFAV